MSKRIWFITGVSSGLGKALAEYIMSKGEFVIGTFRQAEQADAFNQQNKNYGIAYTLDVTNKTQIDETVDLISETYGRIDVVVNNAGIGFAGAIEETSIEETERVFLANFYGTLWVSQAVLPILRGQNSGHIIQISSHGGVKAFAGFGIYNASKFAVEGFSEALADEIKPLGIKLTIIEPGPFRTKFAGDGLGMAANTIEDYNTTAGVFRTKLKAVDGKQEGSPEKAAIAIYDVTRLQNSPLRLVLGKTALSTIGAKIDSLKTDLENSRANAEQVVY